jgi:hypothetical protein
MLKLEIGKLYELTMRDKQGEKKFIAKVADIDYREEGEYFTYIPNDIMHGRWGCAWNRYPEFRKPYGCVNIERIYRAYETESGKTYRFIMKDGNELVATVERSWWASIKFTHPTPYGQHIDSMLIKEIRDAN